MPRSLEKAVTSKLVQLAKDRSLISVPLMLVPIMHREVDVVSVSVDCVQRRKMQTVNPCRGLNIVY